MTDNNELDDTAIGRNLRSVPVSLISEISSIFEEDEPLLCDLLEAVDGVPALTLLGRSLLMHQVVYNNT